MANLLKLVIVLIRLSQSISDTKSKCLVGSFALLYYRDLRDRWKLLFDTGVYVLQAVAIAVLLVKN